MARGDVKEDRQSIPANGTLVVQPAIRECWLLKDVKVYSTTSTGGWLEAYDGEEWQQIWRPPLETKHHWYQAENTKPLNLFFTSKWYFRIRSDYGASMTVGYHGIQVV
jgi:hypothetical protein